MNKPEDPKRSYGLGRVFQRGDRFWIQFNRNGKMFRQSCGRNATRADATRMLKKQLALVESGKPVGAKVDKLTFKDLAEMYLDDLRVNGKLKTKVHAPLESARRFFTDDALARDITTDRLTAFIHHRQGEQAKPATINRSLAAVRRAFNLARRADKVVSVPFFPLLAEHNARQGFLDASEFARLRATLPEDLRDPVGFLYHSAWRVNEMRTLEWRDVDHAGGMVRLRPERSKNHVGRALPLQGELKAIIDRAKARRLPEQTRVFRRDDGSAIGLFRKSWATACDKAKLGAILVHDLRRTAIRNMMRAGVGEQVAMSISGHKTRSVFARYNIVDEADLTDAMTKLTAHLAQQPMKASNVVPMKRHA